MSSVRLRRLQSDYESIQNLVSEHPLIDIEGVAGNPPEKYQFMLRVRSIRENDGTISYHHEHKLEVTLPHGYPRDAPICRMLTPVFHPNIAPHAVCIGDDWSAAESLDLMVQRVGEMLAFQSYNTKSPLNGAAAQWVDENDGQLPIDSAEFFIDLQTVSVASSKTKCDNCNSVAPDNTEEKKAPSLCKDKHWLCADCTMACSTCAETLCLACGIVNCPKCVCICVNCSAIMDKVFSCNAAHVICPDCSIQCPTCNDWLCLACGTIPCPNCTTTCANCADEVKAGLTCSAAHTLCNNCATTCATCFEVLCLSCGTMPCPKCG